MEFLHFFFDKIKQPREAHVLAMPHRNRIVHVHFPLFGAPPEQGAVKTIICSVPGTPFDLHQSGARLRLKIMRMAPRGRPANLHHAPVPAY
jgi:hypothetical protein